METLGQNGRFGNQIFQYFYLKLASELHNAIIHTPKWIGTELFGLSDTHPIIASPRAYEKISIDSLPDSNLRFDHDAIFSKDLIIPVATDFWGYFQLHTSKYI